MNHIKKFSDFNGCWEKYKWYLYDHNALSEKLIPSLKYEFKPRSMIERQSQQNLLDNGNSEL